MQGGVIPKLLGLGSLLSGLTDMPFPALEFTGTSLQDDQLCGPEVREALPNMVAALHAKGVVWQDMAGRNVMRGTDGDLRLIDFGHAVLTDDPEDFAAEMKSLACNPDMMQTYSSQALDS